jgi:hypothetical protein
VDVDPALTADWTRLVDPVTRGDPESPLRWTAISVAKLTAALRAAGHVVGATTVGQLLKAQGYRLQANQKRLEGTDHPERDAQLQHIADQAKAALQQGLPVISVDAKNKLRHEGMSCERAHPAKGRRKSETEPRACAQRPGPPRDVRRW